MFSLKELQAKNEAANAKLRQMVKDQQEAEKKKVQSQEIQQQLAIQTVAIDQKREDVMADLAQVEPAVIDAQTGTYCKKFIVFREFFPIQSCKAKKKNKPC